MEFEQGRDFGDETIPRSRPLQIIEVDPRLEGAEELPPCELCGSTIWVSPANVLAYVCRNGHVALIKERRDNKKLRAHRRKIDEFCRKYDVK